MLQGFAATELPLLARLLASPAFAARSADVDPIPAYIHRALLEGDLATVAQGISDASPITMTRLAPAAIKMASKWGMVEACTMMLTHSKWPEEAVNATDEKGWTALHHAVHKGLFWRSAPEAETGGEGLKLEEKALKKKKIKKTEIISAQKKKNLKEKAIITKQ